MRSTIFLVSPFISTILLVTKHSFVKECYKSSTQNIGLHQTIELDCKIVAQRLKRSMVCRSLGYNNLWYKVDMCKACAKHTLVCMTSAKHTLVGDCGLLNEIQNACIYISRLCNIIIQGIFTQITTKK